MRDFHPSYGATDEIRKQVVKELRSKSLSCAEAEEMFGWNRETIRKWNKRISLKEDQA